MNRKRWSHMIAVAVPLVFVLGGIIVFHDTSLTLFGFPMIFAWLFLWMPLTAIVLHIAWKIEEPIYAEAEAQQRRAPQEGAGE